MPTTHGTPAVEAALDVRADGVRPREVDGGVVPGRVDLVRAPDRRDLVARGREGRREHRADLPPAAEEEDLHATRPARSGTDALRTMRAPPARFPR